MASNYKISFILSIFLTLLATIAAAGGLFLDGLYRDSELIKNAWLGNDIVTLFVAVPLLTISLIYSKKGSLRAQLVWMGLLGYLVYNYAFYLFGAAFNDFFLLYVALFSISVFALILGLSSLDVRAISNRFRPETPRRWLSIFLLFISLPLAVFEISQCLNFIITGNLPEAPSLIFALDLAIVVPNTALAAILLWKNHPWGYVLGLIMVVKAFTYGLVLSLATALIANFSLSGNWDPLMPFYVFVAVGGLISSIVLLKNLKSQNQELKIKKEQQVALSN